MATFIRLDVGCDVRLAWLLHG